MTQKKLKKILAKKISTKWTVWINYSQVEVPDGGFSSLSSSESCSVTSTVFDSDILIQTGEVTSMNDVVKTTGQ